MPFKVLRTEPTPNPNALKFVLDSPITQSPVSFFSADQAGQYPLATKLFAIPGVSSLLFLGDFITVNKSPDAKWKPITMGVTKALSSAESL